MGKNFTMEIQSIYKELDSEKLLLSLNKALDCSNTEQDVLNWMEMSHRAISNVIQGKEPQIEREEAEKTAYQQFLLHSTLSFNEFLNPDDPNRYTPNDSFF